METWAAPYTPNNIEATLPGENREVPLYHLVYIADSVGSYSGASGAWAVFMQSVVQHLAHPGLSHDKHAHHNSQGIELITLMWGVIDLSAN